jgi:hypothetical protein
MVYTFPMALEDFFGDLPIETVSLDLPEQIEMSQNGAGEILTADLGDRLWRADVTIPWRYYDDAEAIKAKLHMLRYAARSLFVTPIPKIAPRYDPTGSKLGASNPTLNAVQPNNRELSIAGLPQDYVLSVGDTLSFTYGSNPTRYALHQIVKGGTTAANGITPLLEVVPFIAPGYALGATVKLIKPVFKAIVEPGSFKPGTSGGRVTTGISFSIIQTFR